MGAAEDQGAVDRVLAGDSGAFEEIVRRWHVPTVNLAYRFCRDRGRAEEMAQEALLRAYRSLDKWRRESSFRQGSSPWRRTYIDRNSNGFQLTSSLSTMSSNLASPAQQS